MELSPLKELEHDWQGEILRGAQSRSLCAKGNARLQVGD